MILASQQQDHVERAVAGAAQSVECVQVLALTRAVSGVVAQQPLLPVVVVVCVEAQHFALGAVVLAA